MKAIFRYFSLKKGCALDLAVSAKGYAAEQAKRCMQASGVQAGIINASGDLCTWGRSPEGAAWTIGIADPFSRLNIFSELELKDMSVATSGDYEKYVIIDGKNIPIPLIPGQVIRFMELPVSPSFHPMLNCLML